MKDSAMKVAAKDLAFVVRVTKEKSTSSTNSSLQHQECSRSVSSTPFYWWRRLDRARRDDKRTSVKTSSWMGRNYRPFTEWSRGKKAPLVIDTTVEAGTLTSFSVMKQAKNRHDEGWISVRARAIGVGRLAKAGDGLCGRFILLLRTQDHSPISILSECNDDDDFE
jgi:hypothetical protein